MDGPLLVLRLGEAEYAVPVAAVREVARPRQVTPIPGAPAPLIGAISLHGDILPIVDPRPVLAIPDGRPPGSRGLVVVVSSGGDEPWCLLVDTIGEVWEEPSPPASLPQGERGVRPPPPSVGEGGGGGVLPPLLDLPRLWACACGQGSGEQEPVVEVQEGERHADRSSED